MTQRDRGHLARLFELLTDLEKGAGLSDLSEVERRLLYAMERLVETSGEHVVRSEQLREHRLVVDVAHPTFYRALKSLRDREMIRVAPNAKTGAYMLSD